MSREDTDLRMIFPGLELSSISRYTLVDFRQEAPRSTEASRKDVN